MGIELAAIHGVYVLFVALIIGFLICRRDTTLICILGILALGWMADGSLITAVSGIFSSFVYAIKELLGTILIISIIVGMSRVLLASGINEALVSPFTRFMRSPSLAYWTLGIVMMVISLFFWPSPAVALIGAVLLPAAVRVGLPALAVAISMNLFGHGIALSGDFIIQGAPKLTAEAAGLPVASVISASIPLVLVMGVVTTFTAFWLIRRDMKSGKLNMSSGLTASSGYSELDVPRVPLSVRLKQFMALTIVFLFTIDVVILFRFHLQGGAATALVGGTAALILVLICILTHRFRALEQTTSYLVDGFLFGFRVFGPVIPIAAFFYLGDSAFTELYGSVLPSGSHGIVNDLGAALAHTVPLHPTVGAPTMTAVGAITGLDGSGFSGISLAGSVSAVFGAAMGSGTDTLTALGQIASIWVGGGTLIPWALIPAAAICGISPFELARRNLVPVLIGLTATTITAILLLLFR
ncbi:hypothetical protein MH117_13810 [Paenibacillus sp. ACRRX]|uniref:hypothetical protein n=1 Tax=Paenibacillus sp. ACRRX TaxID=2918206 RepID=UPI001EF66EFD|nr:hypothetical protein [Paenibacillus sp. ACRRX]MCG7408502.1 hypothetical protein [Paenibacillus sp. ACRRX]